MDACAGMRVWREGLCSCARVKGAPMSGFLQRRVYGGMLARSTNANDPPMIGFLQRRVYGGMLARSTNANGAPMRGCSSGSCERVKSAPTSDFCESVCDADACAEYECERRTDARMLRWLMRTREERADERFLRRRVGRGCLRGVRMRTAHRCADAPLPHAHA